MPAISAAGFTVNHRLVTARPANSAAFWHQMTFGWPLRRGQPWRIGRRFPFAPYANGPAASAAPFHRLLTALPRRPRFHRLETADGRLAVSSLVLGAGGGSVQG